MSKPRHKAYSGKLAKSAPKPKFDGLLGIGERGILERERLELLLRHYGISENDERCWYELSRSLACEHVPGFRKEARGRRQTWSELDEAELYLRVRSLAKTLGGNESAACRKLILEAPYSGQNITSASLYARVKQAKKKNQIVARLIDEECAAERAELVNALRGSCN